MVISIIGPQSGIIPLQGMQSAYFNLTQQGEHMSSTSTTKPGYKTSERNLKQKLKYFCESNLS